MLLFRSDSESDLLDFEAYSIISIGFVGTFLNGFLSVFLLYSLLQRRIISQKIVYLNMVLAEALFSIVGCTLRGPGLAWNLCSSPTICKIARYTESYTSKVDMLAVIPITISILMLTTRGFSSCTAPVMVQLCAPVWVIPGVFLGSFALLGHLRPGSFQVVFTNDSARCNFGGSVYDHYVLGESILFFYVPALACAVMYCVVGFYQLRYQVLGVGRLVRRGLWVTLFYCLCWIPFMVVISLTEHHRAGGQLLSFTYVFYYLSVVINPMTYVVTSKPFQIRIKQFLACTRPAQPPPAAEPPLVHVNDQAEFEVGRAGRGYGSLVETSEGLQGVVTMDDDDSDVELIDGY